MPPEYIILATLSLLSLLTLGLGVLLATSETRWYRRLECERKAFQVERREIMFQLLAQRPAEAAHAIAHTRETSDGKPAPQPIPPRSLSSAVPSVAGIMPPELSDLAVLAENEQLARDRRKKSEKKS
jgi:hypothetical protein